MSNEKDRNYSVGKKEYDETEGTNENYKFLKETIKEKPLNKKRLLLRLTGIIGAGMLFGLAAACTFGLTEAKVSGQIAQREPAEKINIPKDEPEEVTPTPSPIPTETPKPEVSAALPERELGISDYEKIYQDVLQISEKPRKALVTVSGVTGKEVLLDNSYLKGGQSVGVIIVENEEDFYILTETQATDKAKEILVTLADGSIAKGRLQKSDARTGLSVVLLAKEQLSADTKKAVHTAVLGNSYSLIQGKPVIAIGSPSGYHDSVAYGTVTSVLNRLTVTDAEYNLLTTDILGSGEGSGVLLDLNGEVIGVIAQSSGRQDENTRTMVKGLAVSQLKPLIEMLSNGESIRYLGIRGQDVTRAISRSTKIPVGVYVDEVEEDSPAMHSGIQRGDVIVKMDGQEVPTMQRYSTLLQRCEENQKISLKLMRSRGQEGYSPLEIELTVEVK